MRRVLLSLVISSFNKEKTLEDCVESVRRIAADVLDVELIIVDDYSSDRSCAIGSSLKERIPGLVLLRHDRPGLHAEGSM